MDEQTQVKANEATEINTDTDDVLEESELLLEMVRSIVNNPAKVSVEATKGKDTTLLILTVDPDDRGHVIGRDRRTLDALRHLFSKAAYLENRRTIIQLGGPHVPRKPRIESSNRTSSYNNRNPSYNEESSYNQNPSCNEEPSYNQNESYPRPHNERNDRKPVRECRRPNREFR